MLLGATDASALDVCDALGLSGLTISSDAPLTIRGGVDYEFRWTDDDRRARDDSDGFYWDSDLAAEDDCDDYSWVLGDLVRFSNFRVNLDPGFIFTAPDSIGLLESGLPVTTVPGYTLPVSYTGFKLGVGVETQMRFDGFVPMDLGLDFEFGQMTGKGHEGARTGSYGIPSVGLINGSGVGAVPSIDSTDYTTSRTYGGFDKQLHVPLFGGQHEWMGYDSAYVGYVIAGTRFGALNETQQTRIVIPGSTISYDTAYSGGYAGGYLGLGLDKSMQMPGSDLMIGGHASLTAGLDMHRYHATASVTGGGVVPSTSTYDVSDWVPTVKLGGGLSISKDGWANGWSVGFDGSVSSGYYPTLQTQHSVSNVHLTPGFNVSGVVTGEVSASLRLRF